MQALIDFDGWRKWKDFAEKTDDTESTSKLSVSYQSIAPKKGAASESSATTKAARKEEENERKSKRKSLSVLPPILPEETETPPPELDGEIN